MALIAVCASSSSVTTNELYVPEESVAVSKVTLPVALPLMYDVNVFVDSDVLASAIVELTIGVLVIYRVTLEPAAGILPLVLSSAAAASNGLLP